MNAIAQKLLVLANIVYFSCHDSLLYRSEIDDPLWRSAYLNQSEVMRKVTTQGVALAKSVFNVSESITRRLVIVMVAARV